MEIYLIRHTTPNVEKGICYGQSDLDLASSWEEEFKSITSKLPVKKNCKIVSSPLKRCALLAKRFGENIIFDNRLKELNFGNWELKPWDAIPEKDLNTWMENFVEAKVPNGESYTQLAARVYAFFDDLIDSSEATETIIVITHASPIRAILSRLLKLQLKDSFNMKINYGDVFHVVKDNDVINLKTEITL